MEICVLCKMHVSFLFAKFIRKMIFAIGKMEEYGKIKKEHREKKYTKEKNIQCDDGSCGIRDHASVTGCCESGWTCKQYGQNV